MNGSANNSHSRPPGSSLRRSASPDCGKQHVNYRQRGYPRIETKDGADARRPTGGQPQELNNRVKDRVRPKNEDGADKKIPDNADTRRRGSAAMGVYR